MADTNLTLVDTSGGEYTLTLPADMPVVDAIDGIIDHLKLPAISPDGQGISYRLQLKGTVLLENQTLEQAGVTEGATINLTSQIEAGFSHSPSRIAGIDDAETLY